MENYVSKITVNNTLDWCGYIIFCFKYSECQYNSCFSLPSCKCIIWPLLSLISAVIAINRSVFVLRRKNKMLQVGSLYGLTAVTSLNLLLLVLFLAIIKLVISFLRIPLCRTHIGTLIIQLCSFWCGLPEHSCSKVV